MNEVWVAYVDEVPSLSTTPHEICEPEPLTGEEIVTMWNKLKKKYMQLKAEKRWMAREGLEGGES